MSEDIKIKKLLRLSADLQSGTKLLNNYINITVILNHPSLADLKNTED